MGNITKIGERVYSWGEWAPGNEIYNIHNKHCSNNSNDALHDILENTKNNPEDNLHNNCKSHQDKEERAQEYREVLKKYCDANIYMDVLQNKEKYNLFFSLSASPKELASFLKKHKKWNTIIKMVNTKLLKKIQEIYKIKNLTDFSRIITEVHEIEDVLLYWWENLLKVIEKYAINDQKTFDIIIKGRQVYFLLKYINSILLDKVLWICSTLDDFVKISQSEKMCYFFLNWDSNMITKIRELYNISTVEDVYTIVHKKNMLFLIEHIEYDALCDFLEVLQINSWEDLDKVMQSGKREHYKKAMKNSEPEDVKEIIQEILEHKKGNIIIEHTINDTTQSVGVCPDTELYNEIILTQVNNKKYWLVVYNDQIIGYIKKIRKRNFLALQDVYDDKWNLIFMKGWVYAIFDKQWKKKIQKLKQKYFSLPQCDIQDIGARNPIRKIFIENFEKLSHNFLVSKRNL